MTVSSRTPEGSSGRCPLCHAVVRIEPSCLTGDAPCPCCGHLLWFFRVTPEPRFYEHACVSVAKREMVAALLAREDVGDDSLDLVELVMVFEAELGCAVPDDAAEQFRSLGDLIDYFVREGPERE